jgi:hypothetical protein
MLEAFLPQSATSVVVYLDPTNVRWGAKKLDTFCREVVQVEPDPFTCFLFVNRTRDTLLMYFVGSDDGSNCGQPPGLRSPARPLLQPSRRAISRSRLSGAATMLVDGPARFGHPLGVRESTAYYWMKQARRAVPPKFARVVPAVSASPNPSVSARGPVQAELAGVTPPGR